MKLLFLVLAVFALAVVGQSPVSQKKLEKIKNDTIPKIAQVEGSKHGAKYMLNKNISAHYIGKSLLIATKFILNRVDFSLLPDLNCNATIFDNIYNETLDLQNHNCVDLPKK